MPPPPRAAGPSQFQLTAARALAALREREGLGHAGALRLAAEALVETAGRARGLSPRDAAALREIASDQPSGFTPLVRAAAAELLAALEPELAARVEAPGEAYEALLAAHDARARKQRGSYYTREHVARDVLARALALRGAAAQPLAVVLDPAMGAGRFLLAALAAGVPAEALHGIDRDPLAVLVARASVLLAAPSSSPAALRARLRAGDALGPGALAALAGRVELAVGNPPWVAYAGRQAAQLEPRERADYRARFKAFAGFPTTHGMFIELAARALAPRGVLALLVPTQVADLGGYGPTRAALAAANVRVRGPLEELGFGQFDGVTEPTLVLLATRGDDTAVAPADPRAPWPVTERASARPGAAARTLSPRASTALARLSALPRFAPETFGEAGFQTAGALSRTHLRAHTPRLPARFSVPLREGRCVEPFYLAPPAIALDPDPTALARAGTRLRPPEAYARVAVVIRQTARFPIAAVHAPPCAFRNSLLAGYHPDPWALCALLNSALFRALHLCAQRDGRQEVFPQLKVAHLRALPAPPEGADLAPLGALAREAARAQTARHAAREALVRAFPAARLPRRGLFTPEGDALPLEGAAWEARRAALLKRARDTAGFADALEAARAATARAWEAYRAAQRAIDDAVYALYGIAEDERA